VEDGLNFIPTETNGSWESIFFLQMVPVLITLYLSKPAGIIYANQRVLAGSFLRLVRKIHL
ncbi:MAG: hypothetical protein AB2651_21670, partial [Candidatus Thiodiazotropha sp.]